jgi:hypothetical protein
MTLGFFLIENIKITFQKYRDYPYFYRSNYPEHLKPLMKKYFVAIEPSW